PYPRARRRHIDDRTYYARHHEPVGPHRRARCRPQAGRRHTARGCQQPGRHRRLSWRFKTDDRRGEARVTETLLKVEALEAGYDDVQVLWGISLKVERGSMTTLLGANGAGKTTSLRAITGIIRPYSGRITFQGEEVTWLPAHAKAARGLVLVPEGRQLFSDMTLE